MRTLAYTALASDEGRTVRDIMLHHYHLVGHDVARAKFITKRGITVNGEEVRVSRILAPGDLVEIRLDDGPSERIYPVPGPLEVLYEDEDLICLNKPAGLCVHPSHGHFSDTMANYLAHYFNEKGEPHECRVAGRLDKETSGVICFGKSRSAVAILTRQSERGVRRKIYLALCEGTFEENEGKVELPIEREFTDMQKRVAREGGDYALTFYRIRERYEGYALVELEIATGRTHQIRVHMSHIGHPLVGDALYGHAGSFGMGRTALHAAVSEFDQPFTGERIRVEAPLPADMAALLG